TNTSTFPSTSRNPNLSLPALENRRRLTSRLVRDRKIPEARLVGVLVRAVRRIPHISASASSGAGGWIRQRQAGTDSGLSVRSSGRPVFGRSQETSWRTLLRACLRCAAAGLQPNGRNLGAGFRQKLEAGGFA